MKHSGIMNFVVARAKAEALNRGTQVIRIEDLFLGILKLSELTTADCTISPNDEIHLRALEEELNTLKTLFADVYRADTARLRRLLRRELMGSESPYEALIFTYFKRAEEIAAARDAHRVYPSDLLQAIVEKPTDPLMRVCDIADWKKAKEKYDKKSSKPANGKLPGKKGDDSGDGKKKNGNEGKSGTGKEPEEKDTDGEDTDGEDQPIDEMSVDFLPELTARIRKMRAKLLSTVQGQDHVVHAFAEGMFAAQVLAASDENRQRPKAIFAFVGPPGVGKTFLAEQAAQELGLPYKRFDMSTYAEHQSFMGLVGWEKSYQAAAPGLLTGFVKENPQCILLFDEIEKAHLNTVQLFLQILDAGRLADRYHGTDVSFRDTIIIFTSNAGRSLYEGDARQNAAGVSRKTLLNALETELDPRTKAPFFPAAITSRLATGWALLFNHLEPHNLEKISLREMNRFCELFETQYGVSAMFDSLLPTALLFREGGSVDARTLRAQTELFFKNEIFKVCRLWGEENFHTAVKRLKEIRFTLETDSLTAETRPLFFCEEKHEILIFGDAIFAERCRQALPGYTIYDTLNTEEALQIAGEKDIRLVLLDIAGKNRDVMETIYEGAKKQDLLLSAGAFDFTPMAAGAFHDGAGLFRALKERLPELPVYLLETGQIPLDPELTMSFIRAGARGKLAEPKEDFSVFEDLFAQICRELYLQSVASKMAAERKVLYFETAPQLSEDKTEVKIRLREFSLRRAPAAEDAGSVLDEVEKPDTRFSDVIGASDAKDELKFFIDYLRNPKKFSAQGLKLPKGVLLYGLPGTGKTMLARAMAGESEVAFLPSAASSFVTKWQGSGPAAVRELFQRARRYAPAIIFIDEIDAIGRKRGESNSAHGEEMALNALLTEMDGFSVDPKRPVFVLGATNFDVEEGKGGLGVIDPALARRFDRKILVDLPNEDEREQLLRILVKKNGENNVTDLMLRRTAERSMGMSPAILTGVVELANRMAVKAGKPLDDTILDEAFELTKHGEKKDWGYEYLERVARHESGHAFLCYLGGNTPAYLTIVARGGHGGYMEHSAKEMSPLSTKEELIWRIRTSLGGRAAEIAYYGEEGGISTGASGDLEQATKLAGSMLCSYGMDEEFGLAVMNSKDALRDNDFRKRVNALLREEMRTTVKLILDNKSRIDRLVEALMKKNKLTGPEMEELLKDF